MSRLIQGAGVPASVAVQGSSSSRDGVHFSQASASASSSPRSQAGAVVVHFSAGKCKCNCERVWKRDGFGRNARDVVQMRGLSSRMPVDSRSGDVYCEADLSRQHFKIKDAVRPHGSTADVDGEGYDDGLNGGCRRGFEVLAGKDGNDGKSESGLDSTDRGKEDEWEDSMDSIEGLTAEEKEKASKLYAQHVESQRQNSRDSSEGLITDPGYKENESQKYAQHIEKEQGRSRDSSEGLTAVNSADGKKNMSGTELAENNPEWKNIFPAYMRSRESEEESSEDCSNGAIVDNSNGTERNAGSIDAAAVAVATAKEFDSKYGSRTSRGKTSAFVASNPSEEGRLRELISHDPVWAAIRAEARLEAEREPLLSSFLYASILAHPCFERSLGFVLANRLKNATLLATQLLDVFDDVFMNDAYIRQAIRLDVQAVKDRDPSCQSYSLALLYLKGYHAVQAYRVSHALWNRGQKVLALALQSRISEVLAVDIHPAARLGKAILLDHGTGVVIGETAVVGDRVSMLHGVTLGGTGKAAGDRHPKIKEGVLIGAGANILGNIVVGRGAMVAAGSLVLKSVPPHSMVAGTPAKVVGYLDESIPSLTMKQDATKKFCQDVQRREMVLDGGAGI